MSEEEELEEVGESAFGMLTSALEQSRPGAAVFFPPQIHCELNFIR